MKNNRRNFLKQITSGAVGATLTNSMLPVSINLPSDKTDNRPTDKKNERVSKVYVNFKTHWDIGFTASARKIRHNLIHWHIPETINTANQMRMKGINDRLVCTFGSWAVYECLQNTKGQKLKELELAIEDDIITWNAMPFTMHCEYLDRSLFDYTLNISKKLDEKFGKKTIAAKLTDVPSHSIGIVPALSQAGVKLLHIGVNWACVSPEVPPIFLWKHPDGDEVIVMYDHDGYGSAQMYKGYHEMLGLTMKGDNMNPWTLNEVTNAYENYRKTYPNALVIGSRLDDYTKVLLKFKDKLPVVEEEHGDTWIYGTGSDPAKTARFRELSRLRKKWIEQNQLNTKSTAYYDFCTNLALVGEHTWGLDHNTYLDDNEHYESKEFKQVKNRSNYRFLETSWLEQREYIDNALNSLKPNLKEEANYALKELEPKQPDTTSYEPINKKDKTIKTNFFTFKINDNGALHLFKDKSNRREWFKEGQGFGLLQYQTFDDKDYIKYYKAYFEGITDPEFPGIAASYAESNTWKPTLKKAYYKEANQKIHILLFLSFNNDLVEKYGAPKEITNEFIFDEEKKEIEVTLQWFNKQACRLPEALWYSFFPDTSYKMGWMMDKMGTYISPYEVIYNGNRSLHAIQNNVRYADKNGKMIIESKDAHLANFGALSLLNFQQQLPDMSKGLHFNLLNNVWKTNFRAWYNDNAKFRYLIKVYA